MLFNPNWKTETKDDLEFSGVSLSGLIAWLETKDQTEWYDYGNPFSCALAQYRSSLGLSGEDVVVDFGFTPMPSDNGYWLYQIVEPSPRTFGAALSRARRLKRLENRDDGAAE